MRYKFIDALRGLAVLLMVINHTGRWWLASGNPFGYEIIYFTVTLSAPIFLFLVGFCLSLSFDRAKQVKKLPDRKIILKYISHGLLVIALGYIFNLLVFSEDSILRGKVLQTIGISIILSIPFLYFVSGKYSRIIVLSLAGFIYFSFGALRGVFQLVIASHPLLAYFFFSSFTLVPFFSFVLLGLVLGKIFIARAQNPERLAKFWAVVATLGISGLVMTWLIHTLVLPGQWLSFYNDYVFNGYWVPNYITFFWIVGMIFVLLSLTYYALAIKGRQWQWLATLGQTALILYFVHHLVALVLISQLWGWTTGSMIIYIIEYIFCG